VQNLEKLSDLTVYTTQAKDNTWLAATNRAPFFCFEATTEKGALAIARAALRFYTEVTCPDGTEGGGSDLENFRTSNQVSARELLAA
jgi:hypothetical protein